MLALVAAGIVLVLAAVGIPILVISDLVAEHTAETPPAFTIPAPAPLVAGGAATPPGQADAVQAAQAVSIAQALLDDLAAGRVVEARGRLATGRYADSDVDDVFPVLVRATVVGVRAWALDDDRVDLRAVLVLEEDPLAGRRTRAVCARWVVDTTARLVRVRGEKELLAERGAPAPLAVAERVAAACADTVLS